MPALLTVALYLFGNTMDPGTWGGCAVTWEDRYPMLECTYGALAECVVGEPFKLCQVPVYLVDLSRYKDPVRAARIFIYEAYHSDKGWSSFGPPQMTMRPGDLTHRFTLGCDNAADFSCEDLPMFEPKGRPRFLYRTEAWGDPRDPRTTHAH